MKIKPVGNFASVSLTMMRQHRILGSAPDDQLSFIISRSSLVSLDEREILFKQGDAGRAVILVLVGFVKLSSVGQSGHEMILEICGPGSLFGELAVLNDWPRSADASALSGCPVLSMPGATFRDAVVRSPEIMFALIGVVSRRLRLATKQLHDATSLPGPARFAKALVELTAAYGRPLGSGLQLDIHLSQRELGSLTGLTRESINKQLAAWRDRGWIEISSKHITLLAVEALRCVADGSGLSPDE